MRRFLVGTAMLLVMAVPTEAGIVSGAFEAHGPCFARHYDDAHLKRHPDQRVRAVYLSDTAVPEPGYDGSVLVFGFKTRDGEAYAANAYCSAEDRCSIEGDGGSFSVTDTAEGLLLDVGAFLELEGPNGFSGDLTESDDRAFIIYPDKLSACQLD